MSIKNELNPGTLYEIDEQRFAGVRPDTGLLSVQSAVVFLLFAVMLSVTMLVELYVHVDGKQMITIPLFMIGLAQFAIGLVVVNWDVKVIENAARDPVCGQLVRREWNAPWTLVVMSVFPLCIVTILIYGMLITTGKDYV